MNWEERLDIKYKITTGDGQDFFPLWRGGEKEKEYNTSSFEFINVTGTLVDRKKPQGSKYNLVFWFDGANNIEEADRFETSCDDPRQWTIVHPFYGTILGQPLSIKRDDKDLNITEITIPFWESISPDFPFTNFSKKDNTREKSKKTLYALSLAATTGTLFEPQDISKWGDSLGTMNAEMSSLNNNNTYADFQNAFNDALGAIDDLLSGPLQAAQSVQNFLDLPSTYEQAIKGRVAAYENVYWNLKNSIETVTDKKYYESMAGTVLSLISVVLVTPIDGDYITVSDVEQWLSTLKVLYQDYQNTLDEISVDIYDVNNAYSPNADAQNELNSLITYVSATLYTFTFGVKKERIIITSKDTNVILLTHRYLGLDVDDENIEIMINTNNLLFNEKFIIKKGREIKFIK
jgi:hypothetical protein